MPFTLDAAEVAYLSSPRGGVDGAMLLPELPAAALAAKAVAALSPFEELAGLQLPYAFVEVPSQVHSSKSKRALSACISGSCGSLDDAAHVLKERKASVAEPMCQAATVAAPAAVAAAPVAAAVEAAMMDVDALIAASTCKPTPETAAAAAAAALASNGMAAADVAVAVDDVVVAAHCGPFLPADTLPGLPRGVRHVLGTYSAGRIACGASSGIAAAAAAHIAATAPTDTFYIYDLGEVARLYALWRTAMPRVMPFYAVKCNPEPALLATLNALGCGFDCASIGELKAAGALAVPQSRIIFANPCKKPADFRYAKAAGVETTTFDCASELEKIAAGYPSFKCVLRIRCDDETSKINLGLKYGADPKDAPALLALAKELGLTVVGVSFHVGSGCQNVRVYADAIAAAREAFDVGEALGFSMHLLDIGGGFTAPYDAPNSALFAETTLVVNEALEAHFPARTGVRIIAEPGRYFAETSATLFTTILGQRVVSGGGAAGEAQRRDYWLSDGTYGSFRIQVAVDGLEPSYSVLRSPLLPPPTPAQQLPGRCRLWGNSHSAGDCVHKEASLPLLREGDWLMFAYAGAYTICSASNFGGVCMTAPSKVFVFSEAAHEAEDSLAVADVVVVAGADVAAGVAGAEVEGAVRMMPKPAAVPAPAAVLAF